MARLRPAVFWVLGGRAGADVALDARLPALVASAAAHGTLGAAARDVGLSYRSAWGLIEHATELCGEPVLTLSRGKGASLAPLGERLLAAHRAAVERVADDALAVPLRGQKTLHPPARMLRVAASHDIALAQLRDRWRLAHGIAVDFVGSELALAAYVSGSSEIAGFHVATEPRGASDALLDRLDPKRDGVIRFLRREQGLIVPRGNPRRVKAIADIAAKRLTIVNRQAGSGTRLLLDRLLARERIDAESIAGYTSEEFTHAAVAATVAAGRADVGFGIAAAAAQFGLGFVPLAREQYLFACRRRQLASARIGALRALLASDATRAVVAPLAGYALDAPGAIAELVPRAGGGWRIKVSMSAS
jgi:molybdate transport repressor ModE-like protein